MKLNRSQAEFLEKILNKWQEEGLLDPEQVKKLKVSYSTRKFDWKELARYTFLIALISGILAIIALLSDNVLLTLIDKLISLPSALLAVFFAGLAALSFRWGFIRKKAVPHMIFTNEIILFLAAGLVACSIAFTGSVFGDIGYVDTAWLFFLAAVTYGVLSVPLRSVMLWLLGFASLSIWFGLITSFSPDWKDYFLGLNLPARFALWGVLWVCVSRWLKHRGRLHFQLESTYFIALLILFVSLWLLSVFGNSASWEEWSAVKQLTFLPWSILLAIVSCIAIYLGIKKEEFFLKMFGIAFVFINLYTRFFEFFWDHLHKAIFFTLLAISFWLISRKAENIWNLESGRKTPARRSGK